MFVDLMTAILTKYNATAALTGITTGLFPGEAPDEQTPVYITCDLVSTDHSWTETSKFYDCTIQFDFWDDDANRESPLAAAQAAQVWIATFEDVSLTLANGYRVIRNEPTDQRVIRGMDDRSWQYAVTMRWLVGL